MEIRKQRINQKNSRMIIDFEKAKKNSYQPCDIIDLVCKYFDVSIDKITSPSRLKEVVTVRKYACYMLVKHCRQNTLLDLSTYVGYKSNGSHATVLFHYQDLIKKSEIYSDTKRIVKSLENFCKIYFENLYKMEGYTIKDAIMNPSILDVYKK